MAGSNQYKAQQFIDKIPGTGGIITTIAARVGCSWHTAKKYIEKFPTIKRAYNDEVEAMLDMAEGALLAAIKEGDWWAVKYFLSTRGKDRGYTERREVTGAEGREIVVKGYVTVSPDDWPSKDEPKD